MSRLQGVRRGSTELVGWIAERLAGVVDVRQVLRYGGGTPDASADSSPSRYAAPNCLMSGVRTPGCAGRWPYGTPDFRRQAAGARPARSVGPPTGLPAGSIRPVGSGQFDRFGRPGPGRMRRNYSRWWFRATEPRRGPYVRGAAPTTADRPMSGSRHRCVRRPVPYDPRWRGEARPRPSEALVGAP